MRVRMVATRSRSPTTIRWYTGTGTWNSIYSGSILKHAIVQYSRRLYRYDGTYSRQQRVQPVLAQKYDRTQTRRKVSPMRGISACLAWMQPPETMNRMLGSQDPDRNSYYCTTTSYIAKCIVLPSDLSIEQRRFQGKLEILNSSEISGNAGKILDWKKCRNS